MNEFDLIRRLREQTRSRKHSSRLVTGIGDDASVVNQIANRDLVVTTDLLIEGVDFYRDAAPARMLGHKALAVSLSDIAAMGARPFWSLLSIGMPKAIWQDRFKEEFFAGYFELADKFGVTLAGGDVSEAKEAIVIDSIVLGEVPTGAAVLRSGARPGDQIYVTGTLGGAAAGLKHGLFKGLQGGPSEACPPLQKDEMAGTLGFARPTIPQKVTSPNTCRRTSSIRRSAPRSPAQRDRRHIGRATAPRTPPTPRPRPPGVARTMCRRST